MGTTEIDDERSPAQVLAMTLKRLYPQNPDNVLGREARTIIEEFEKAGHVVSRANEAGTVAVLRAKVSMYEAWLRENAPTCPLLAENIVEGA